MRNPFKTLVSSNSYSSLHSSVSFLPPGVNVRYELELKRANETLLKLFQDLEKQLLAPILERPIITNVKGSAAKDSLFQLTGTIQPEGEEAAACRLSIITQFHDFAENDQIRFKWHEEHEPELLQGLKRYEIPLREDITISHLTLTLELFKSTIITRLTRFGPVAAEAITFDVSSSSASLWLRSDGLPSLSTMPAAQYDIFKRLNALISSHYRFELITDYTKHVEKLSN